MSIVNGKCPNCGASIKLDKDKDAGICEYCGSAYVTEKAIINNGTYINKQEIHNVKQDNEWTYKINEQKSKEQNKFVKGTLIVVAIGFIMMFLPIILSHL